ncbi:FAD-dependent monooxygenase [Kineosporia sp. J2-2]|uniref:FAD-dependent monooxygenase n=1 Tax=Kineosporia corallincola TaxID=2835133 RepID=A0ABS5TL65_9ACTN|nr:FAD-dependent monooxygenase [Kineosporia corallincola]MBT0771844.1 FAD-dependent monooxygenase [Kineosporia corallincola]
MARRRALIAGGGLGGLAAALALYRRGWDVCVFEQGPDLEPVGAGISLWPNGLRSLDQLGIGDAVRAAGRSPGAGGVRQPDGTWLLREDLSGAVRERFGDPLLLLHRADLAEVVVRALPFGVVQASTRVLGVHPGGEGTPATVITEHGESDADLVVAADGIRSGLRGFLFPRHAEPSPEGYSTWRMVVPDPGGLDTGFETWGSDGRRFAVAPLAGDRLYCYATASQDSSDGQPAARQIDRLHQHFGDWHEPIPAILAGLTDDRVLHHPVEDLNPGLPAFHRGRVALIGDAAHAMTPDLGQGGGMALEDAVVLASLVGDGRIGEGYRSVPIPAALEEFSAQRQPRTGMVARRSRRMGRLSSVTPYPAQVMAARALSVVPGRPAARGLTSIVGWRPPELPPADPPPTTGC